MKSLLVITWNLLKASHTLCPNLSYRNSNINRSFRIEACSQMLTFLFKYCIFHNAMITISYQRISKNDNVWICFHSFKDLYNSRRKVDLQELLLCRTELLYYVTNVDLGCLQRNRKGRLSNNNSTTSYNTSSYQIAGSIRFSLSKMLK